MGRVIVVTNPELGWDCVVGVFDANVTTEDDIKSVYGSECVFSERTIEIFEKPTFVYQTKIKEMSDDRQQHVIHCIVDNLEIITDTNDLLYSKTKNTMIKTEDCHILGEMLLTLIKDKNINTYGGEVVVVKNPKFSYVGMLFPNQTSLINFSSLTDVENEFEDYLTQKGIELY